MAAEYILNACWSVKSTVAAARLGVIVCAGLLRLNVCRDGRMKRGIFEQLFSVHAYQNRGFVQNGIYDVIFLHLNSDHWKDI